MKYLQSLFILLLFPFSVAATGYIPLRNFPASTYGAGAQNWCMDCDNLGRVYVANRNGLLRFDGLRWRLFNLPNHTTVRSVLADTDSGRIYAGGSDEFGYFIADANTGVESYHSLSSTVSKSVKISEVWNIMKSDNGYIFFQSDFCIICINPKSENTPTVIKSTRKISTSTILPGESAPIVGFDTGGVARCRNGRLIDIADNTPLMGKRICGILDFNGNFLIATNLNGLFYHDGFKTIPFPTSLDSFIIENQLFCSRRLGDDIALGTVNAGVAIMNLKSGDISFVNRNTGLLNNTVLNMGYDRSGSLWMCLDNGLAVAFPNSPVWNLLGANHDTGAGYASILYRGNLLLGTNQALFSLPWPSVSSASPAGPRKILNGQVWSIDTIGNTLFICSDRGLFQSSTGSADNLSVIPNLPGTWMVRSLNSNAGYALASTYNHFHLLQKRPSGWIDLGVVKGYDDVGGRFAEDNAGNIWLGHWLNGVYRMKFDLSSRSFKNIRLFTTKDGLPSNNNNSVLISNGTIYIGTEYGVYRMLPSGRAVKDNTLSAGTYPGEAVHLLPLGRDHIFSFSSRGMSLLRRDKDSWNADTISLRRMCGHMIPGFENIGRAGNDIIVGNQDGFFLISPHKHVVSRWLPKTFIASVYAQGDSLLYSAPTTQENSKDFLLQVPFSLNSLRFDLAMTEFRGDGEILFSCLLEDYDKTWTPLSAVASKEYTRLHEGSYTLHVRAFNPSTGQLSESSFSFRVLPPWWRSMPANVVYMVLAIVALYFSFKMIKNAYARAARRITQRQEEEYQRLKQAAEQENLRKDYEIAALKSEQLEKDIKHKSSELSNITMNVIRKNEILLNISSRLDRLCKQAESREDGVALEIQRIRKSISHNISHDDDWKNFNQNFDIVYENYTKRLMELYPSLSKTELRICCYLKMGLSSKEIAPLFNINPRSVEMSRYRLRRKMGLEREVNLTTYLQNL
ncbi:MAG: LuxR C-terminal-related transcriptional regulator [Clostridium sp.]|nr:LuxR C-terminal-related transcriptional regulator [Prevotella sp.]MCM1429091.1 LuxR C-terminal-related transcriptional regulator [Clostridium sp.]